MTTGWHQAWAAALARLEAGVAEAEALLAEEHRTRELPVLDPWRPPEGLGPLPLDLRPVADAVLRRQLAVAARLVSAMTGTAKHAAVLSRLDDGHEAPRPAYVDYAI